MKFASLLASAAVAAGVATAKNVSPLKLDFEVQRGDSPDNMARDNQPYLRRRAGDVEMTIGNSATFYLATLVVGSQGNKVTVLVDTGSSDLWLMSHEVQCVSVSGNSRRDFSTVDKRNPIMRRDVSGTEDATDEEAADEEPTNVDKAFGFGTDVIVITTIIGPGGGGSFPTGFGGPGSGGGLFGSPGAGSGSGSTNTCTDYGSFATGSSDSFKLNSTAPSFQIEYADGTEALGVWGHDTVAVGNASLSSLSFGVVNQTSSNIGVLGIGLPGLETTFANNNGDYMYENLPIKLRNEGFINKNAYSLYLNTIEADTGSVLFGAVDHAKYTGQLQTVQIINSAKSLGFNFPIRLEVLVSGMDFNVTGGASTTVTENSYPAILDSGSTLSYLPTALFNRLGELLGGSFSSSFGTYLLPCTSNPNYNLVINFSGAKISVPLSNLLLPFRGGQCQLGILEQQTSPGQPDSILFGDNVLRNAYIVYDLDGLTVSFAQAKYTDETDIEIITSDIPRAVSAAQFSSTAFSMTHDEASATQEITYSTGALTATTADVGTAVGVASNPTSGSGGSGGSGSGSGSGSGGSSSSGSSSSNGKASGSVSIVFGSVMHPLLVAAIVAFITLW